MPKVADRPVNRLREATALLDSPEISALFDKVRATVDPPLPEPPFPPAEPVLTPVVALSVGRSPLTASAPPHASAEDDAVASKETNTKERIGSKLP